MNPSDLLRWYNWKREEYLWDILHVFYQGHGLYILSGQSAFVWLKITHTFHINRERVNTVRSVFQNRSHMSATSTHSLRESRSNVSLWHAWLSGNDTLFGNPVWLPGSWLVEALMLLRPMSFTRSSNAGFRSPYSWVIPSLCPTLTNTIWESLLTFPKAYKRQG